MWDPSIGLDWVLICFAALCVMVIAFVFRYLPETQTQGLSVEQIVQEFEREAQKTGSSPFSDRVVGPVGDRRWRELNDFRLMPNRIGSLPLEAPDSHVF